MEDNAPWVTTETKPPEKTSIWVWRKGELPVPATFIRGTPKAKLIHFRPDIVFLLGGVESRFDYFHSWKYLSPPDPPLGLDN